MPPLEMIESVALDILAPGVLASAVVLGLAVIFGGQRAAFAASALALLAGFSAGNARSEPILPWARDETYELHWLLWSVVPSLLLGLIARAPRVPASIAWPLRIAGASLSAWLLMPLLPTPAEGETRPMWIPFALAAAILAVWAVAEESSRRPEGPDGAWGLTLACAGAAVVLLYAHFARSVDAALLLAAALVGIAGIASWKKVDSGGAAPAAAVLLLGLLLAGYSQSFSEVPLTAFLLVGLAPLALVPTLLPAATRLGRLTLCILRLGLVLVPVAAAGLLAMKYESLDFSRHKQDGARPASAIVRDFQSLRATVAP